MGQTVGRQETKVRINPYLREQGQFAAGQARDIYDQFRGSELPSLYVAPTTQTQEGLAEIEAQARAGGGPGYQEYARTVSGERLGANPYLDAMVDRATRNVPDAFTGAGRFGSGAYANALASARTQLYGQNYENERNRMLSAIGMAPAMDYAPQQALAGVGQTLEDYEQRQRMEELRQYEGDASQLAQFQDLLAGNPLMAESNQTVRAIQPFDWGNFAGAILGGICHAAAEYFGWYTPKWFAARDAIAAGKLDTPRWSFRDWYTENSEHLAARIREDEEVKRVWAPVFEAAAIHGQAMAEDA